MTLKENWPTIGRADVKVLATDIDPGMVAAAAEASTPAQQVGDDPPALLLQNMSKVTLMATPSTTR
jgi:chemotaxis methyl-accepting protein methylase